MPDDDLTQRFTGLRERLLPLVEAPEAGAIERRGRRRQRARRAGALLTVAAVAAGAWMLVATVSQRWPGGDLRQGPVSPAPPPSAPATTPPPTTTVERTDTTGPPTTTRPAPSSTAAPTTTPPVQGLRILEPRPGTLVRPGQMVRMRGVGCPPGRLVSFEDGTGIEADQDGSFTTAFEIPPGPAGDFYLDARCGGITREVKLRRSP